MLRWGGNALARMYRNYDGQGGAFGDAGVSATSSDADQLSAYAAERNQDGALTVLLINKSAGALDARIQLAGFAPGATAGFFRYGATDLDAIRHEAPQSLTAAGFTTSVPAESITLFELPPR